MTTAILLLTTKLGPHEYRRQRRSCSRWTAPTSGSIVTSSETPQRRSTSCACEPIDMANCCSSGRASRSNAFLSFFMSASSTCIHRRYIENYEKELRNISVLHARYIRMRAWRVHEFWIGTESLDVDSGATLKGVTALNVKSRLSSKYDTVHDINYLWSYKGNHQKMTKKSKACDIIRQARRYITFH